MAGPVASASNYGSSAWTTISATTVSHPVTGLVNGGTTDAFQVWAVAWPASPW
ncbi:MAG: hypothetical protein OXC96_04260 [Cyanobacteria bacterium MAG CAR1_bin_15]|nr:hypothetical protein [Cyanobacteria bacterium MAG CAR1_bin_15]